MDMGWIMTFMSPGNPTAQVSILREDASAPVIPQITVEVTDVGTVAEPDGETIAAARVAPRPWCP